MTKAKKVFQTNRSVQGFTLLELLAMMGLLALISVLSVSIFFSVMRTTKRIKVTEKLKQEGDHSLSVMTRMLRNAVDLDSCTGSPVNSFEITNRDNLTTTFTCSSDQIASNSAVLIGDVQVDCSDFITCTLGSEGIYEIVVDFTLSRSGTSLLPYQEASIDFRTTVTPRNL